MNVEYKSCKNRRATGRETTEQVRTDTAPQLGRQKNFEGCADRRNTDSDYFNVSA